MEQKKEFVKSKQAGWDRIKIWSTKYMFCCKIAGLFENSYNKCALTWQKLQKKKEKADKNISKYKFHCVFLKYSRQVFEDEWSVTFQIKKSLDSKSLFSSISTRPECSIVFNSIS